MTEPSLPQNERELILYALSSIASDAHTITHLCGAAIDADNGETQSSLIAAADKTAASLGALADLVLERMGVSGTRGAPENWLMSPEAGARLLR
ncbi:MAG: hypothetical protein B7Y26_03570 [Hydrogenophilales bacterium 16-64-46]|nr:MAG: hypothetical protein B7Z32_03270 [Hydrogenophilales bacterium 12-64-13]OYZ06872.1 MAG: hypothetical protein B7Y26_03570 [Hydrogenophilales bacterium 16-64-46]OZA37016.1 MAG: hypothetical protein B7X87_11965 [Hydrogenophilales bacterium 17-64-34]HQS99900.1 hypothetical protein [Thiobacillus sp.]